MNSQKKFSSEKNGTKLFFCSFLYTKISFFYLLEMVALTFLQVNVATISTNQLQQTAIY